MADGSHDPKALRAATGISHAEEKRIALSLSPAVAWPTLALAAALPTALLTVIALGECNFAHPYQRLRDVGPNTTFVTPGAKEHSI